MVRFLRGATRNSDAVGFALAEMLGYPAYKDLMEAACLHAKGGAA
jgi:hypothetical protein